MEETFEQLTQEQEKEFIAVEFRNGHFHTVKAFGVWNTWIGAMSSGLENQLLNR